MLEDLTSPDLSEMGGSAEPVGGESDEETTAQDQASVQSDTNSNGHDSKQQTEGSGEPDLAQHSQMEKSNQKVQADHAKAARKTTALVPVLMVEKDTGKGEPRPKRSRPKHKEQWDRRLLSYVRQKQEGSLEEGEQGDLWSITWPLR